MAEGQYISVRETAQVLGITEKKVMDLIDEGGLVAYRIANQFLRLKRVDVLQLRSSGAVAAQSIQFPYTTKQKLSDFIYFNDFYIISTLVIIILVLMIIVQ